MLEIQLVPFDVSTLPFVLGATVVTALVPLPINIPFADRVVAPVPPFATAMAVPFQTPLVIVPT